MLLDAPRPPSLARGFTARLPREEDLPGLVDLYNAVARQRDLRLTDEIDLRSHRTRDEWWLEAIVIERDEDGLLSGYAHFAEEFGSQGDLELWIDGRVHPEATGRSLASFLIATGERRAWGAAQRQHLHGRLSVVVTNDNGNDRARGLYERLGFQAIRHRLAMRIDLRTDTGGAGSKAWGLQIRPFDPDQDSKGLWRAMQAGFADHHDFEPTPYDDWRWVLIDRHDDFDPGLWFVAEADGQIVGGILAEVGVPGDPRLGHVRDLAVVPSWRRRGAADALLQAAFRAFREREVTRAGLDVDDVTLHGALRLYERAGMAVVRRIDIYEKVLRP